MLYVDGWGLFGCGIAIVWFIFTIWIDIPYIKKAKHLRTEMRNKNKDVHCKNEYGGRTFVKTLLYYVVVANLSHISNCVIYFSSIIVITFVFALWIVKTNDCGIESVINEYECTLNNCNKKSETKSQVTVSISLSFLIVLIIGLFLNLFFVVDALVAHLTQPQCEIHLVIIYFLLIFYLIYVEWKMLYAVTKSLI